MINWKEHGNSSVLFYGIIPVFGWKDYGKSWNISVRVADLRNLQI
jgi:hypothetical protein